MAVRNVFANTSIGEMISLVHNAFCRQRDVSNSWLISSIHVQTACESPDLNMDFRSFDNWLKQLYE